MIGGNTMNEHTINIANEIPPKDSASNSSLNNDMKNPIFIINYII